MAGAEMIYRSMQEHAREGETMSVPRRAQGRAMSDERAHLTLPSSPSRYRDAEKINCITK